MLSIVLFMEMRLCYYSVCSILICLTYMLTYASRFHTVNYLSNLFRVSVTGYRESLTKILARCIA